MVRLVFRYGADRIRQYRVFLRRSKLGYQLIAHTRLAFPRKRTGEIGKSFRLFELHRIILLYTLYYARFCVRYTETGAFPEKEKIA